MPFSRLKINQRAVYRGSRRADIDTCSSLDRDKPLKNKNTPHIYNNYKRKKKEIVEKNGQLMERKKIK